jgi:hypothetical protein
MQDLEPPEVPLELSQVQLPQSLEIRQAEQKPKREGFFKRLFSKKPKESEISSQEQILPEIELPKMDNINEYSSDSRLLNIPSSDNRIESDTTNLPMMPDVNEQLEMLRKDLSLLETSEEDQDISESSLVKGKSKGKHQKGQKRKIGKYNEKLLFDWTREIREQEILIHDSNRFNQDVNILMKEADEHIGNKSKMVKNNYLSSEHQDVESLVAPINIEELEELSESVEASEENNTHTPAVDTREHAEFMKIAMSHKKLRSTLNKYLKNKKLFSNKAKLQQLLRMYDESVERYIEDKELELTKKKRELSRTESRIKTQEQQVREMHLYVKELDTKLKDRESEINSIIVKNVEKELTRRMKTEKKRLNDELKKTIALNTNLKKKIKIIEDDRIRFDTEHKRMSESERKKLNDLQMIYEKKMRDADSERKEFEEKKRTFEERRKVSLELLKVADSVSKELQDVKQMKEYVDVNKKHIDKELNEDKELKTAINKAEAALVKEKENLDNMIFSRYIENKLKSIKPEYLDKREDWKTELKSNPLYEQINHCKKLLSQHSLAEAKSLYNSIRKAYDQVHTSRKEKEALYTTIRELYNDIQLKIVETQVRRR